MNDREAVDILRNESEEFRTLETEHLTLERTLDEMNKRKHLTPEEEMERKTIQKQKLAKKDRMAELLRLKCKG
ncbi:MAG: DUF465 domain-containing protein [Nitrospirae bacterium]|nr:DUF465 domain-containing protein [Nitrospirota bacterium]